MCCFSGPVKDVGQTKIFVRAEPGAERQSLVYAMRFTTSDEVAMVLPIPVAEGAGADAVRFVDLSGYPDFFADVELSFPAPPRSRGFSANGPPMQGRLVVHQVGNLDASFVPTANDFGRLDPRFHLPASVWDRAPTQRGYGFVVVKLAASASPQDAHPIAFDFPRRDRQRAFFPTLHVHDGQVHETARFDHSLYLQGAPGPEWQESLGALTRFVDLDRSGGLIADTSAWKLNVFGEHANDDFWV